MAKKNNEAIKFVIISGIIYFWYNVSGVIFNALEGQSRALLSILLGIVTWLSAGDKLEKFI